MRGTDHGHDVAPAEPLALPDDPVEVMWGSLIYAAVSFCVAFFLRFGF